MFDCVKKKKKKCEPVCSTKYKMKFQRKPVGVVNEAEGKSMLAAMWFKLILKCKINSDI